MEAPAWSELTSMPEAEALITNRRTLAISPDGSRIAYVGYDGPSERLLLRSLDDGSV